MISSDLIGFQPNPIDIDWSPAVRRMKSQFTDVTDYRRNGRNTWNDESGIYANEGNVKGGGGNTQLNRRDF